MRGTILVETDAPEEQAVAIALADPAIGRHIEGRSIRKKIYVKNRILNIVL
jgi:leucyl-tRNA synthetase